MPGKKAATGRGKVKHKPLRVGVNPRAHESDERRVNMLKHMEIKRLRNVVGRQEELLQHYIPVDKRVVKRRPDPNWVLKGAARPAQEFYIPPDHQEEPKEQNLLEIYDGKLSQHEEGVKFMEALAALARALQNIAGKSKEAIKILKRGLDLDKEDALKLRYALLRVYLDEAQGAEARQLLDEFPLDRSSCFTYSRALLEFISWKVLQEDGASQQGASDALTSAIETNPFAVWYIAFPDIFTDVVEYTNEIQNPPPGSVEDAFSYCENDLSLWRDTDGSIDWVRDHIRSSNLRPPILSKSQEEVNDISKKRKRDGNIGEDLHVASSSIVGMYSKMFETAIEMLIEMSLIDSSAAS